MIQKVYEITCDGCGWASHYMKSIRNAEKQAREEGMIITKDKKHFCDSKCYTAYKSKKDMERAMGWMKK